MSNVQTVINFPIKKKPCTSNKENTNKIDLKRSSLCESNDASPPKQILCEKSPSQLIANIKISSPVFTKKKLVHRDLFDVKTSDLTLARQAFHSSTPSNLPSREDKLNVLRDFILNRIQDDCSGTLYISGPPGTGKTACINYLMESESLRDSCQIIFVNCASVKSAGSIYSKIIKELKIKSKANNERSYLIQLQNYFKKPHSNILLILDEMDQLDSKRQSVLYSIFEWPVIKNSKLILIGIANALDLTDRVLPRLHAKGLKPELLHFPPYTRQQIIDILQSRISETTSKCAFKNGALQLLAGKIANISGDVRKALDVARRVVDIAQESEHQEISPEHVLNVLNSVYSTSQNLNSNGVSFPLQQKILICALLLLKLKSKNKQITLGRLHEIYINVCNKRNITAIDFSQFLSLADLVESRGAIKFQGKIKNRLSKIILQWDENEITTAFQDKELLASILDDDSCLGK